VTHDEEPLTRLLQRLPQAEVDEVRASRVQARCRKALARRVNPLVAPRPRRARRLESFCVVSLCVAYLITVIQQALQ